MASLSVQFYRALCPKNIYSVVMYFSLLGLVDHVTVLIGIAVGDRSVAGVIHQPYYKNGQGANSQGRTLWGIRGIGVGGFEAQMAPSGQRIIVTTRSHRTPEVHDAVEALQPAKVMYVGGAGHKVREYAC